MRNPATALAAALALLAPGAALADGAEGSAAARAQAAPAGAKAWRAARWGMSPDQVEKAFPGEIVRFKKPATLNDGNVIPLGIEKIEVESTAFEVRFVFADDKLALVSLRTFQDKYADPAVYLRLQKHLAAELAGPGDESKDDAFFDLRQTRWKVPGGQVDLKYIPGVVVILYSASGTP